MLRKGDGMSAKGFTLVEAAISLTILCVLAAIAYPELGMWQGRTDSRAEVADVVSHLQKARGAAIQRNIPVEVRFREDGYEASYVHDRNSTSESCSVENDEECIFTITLKSGVAFHLEESLLSGGVIVFSGTATGDNGSLVIRGVDGTRSRIRVNTAGKIRVEEI